ncbi:hypothetical protein HS7_18220 [Sulfolobales archaeon HS-7]|nr:hypothetical protein HS7_18220 [Sulfolobales archaeon HS-7]
MSTTFTDLVNIRILGLECKSFESTLESKNLKLISRQSRRFLQILEGIKHTATSTNLREIINREIKSIKRLLLLLRIRYIIVFYAKELITRAINTIKAITEKLIYMLL